MRMFNRHVSHQLVAHIDGELTAQEAERVDLHLGWCKRCRGEHQQLQLASAMLDHLPAAHAPDAIWAVIEAALPHYAPKRPPIVRGWRLAFVALALITIAGMAYWVFTRRPAPFKEPAQMRTVAHIKAGQWIETDSSSSATVKIGEIGSVEVGPGTRLLVVSERSDEHRLALARGQIYAKISAPPKLFFVDTPSGTAIDLGCEYSLHADEHGAGLLQVTKGWVSFQWKGLESLVPAGASCRTRPQAGPAVPYFDDAPPNFKQAVEAFTTQKSVAGSLDPILAEARVRDTLTLWHLLFRVGVRDRERIYDRIAALTPVPAGVSRDKVMKLDPDTLTRWKDELAWTW